MQCYQPPTIDGISICSIFWLNHSFFLSHCVLVLNNLLLLLTNGRCRSNKREWKVFDIFASFASKVNAFVSEYRNKFYLNRIKWEPCTLNIQHRIINNNIMWIFIIFAQFYIHFCSFIHDKSNILLTMSYCTIVYVYLMTLPCRVSMHFSVLYMLYPLFKYK